MALHSQGSGLNYFTRRHGDAGSFKFRSLWNEPGPARPTPCRPNRPGGRRGRVADRLARRIGGDEPAGVSTTAGSSRWQVGLVQVPTGKHPPRCPLRSDMLEAKTDAGHKGTWLCRCGATARERRAQGRRGGMRKAEETKNSRVLIIESFESAPFRPTAPEVVDTEHRAGRIIRKDNFPSGSGSSGIRSF